ncbi:hypothetical protein JCM19037_2582 [Geomicrobium sp. JCM 19037]|uniref:DUF2624 family protein n=1 Tax=unclassified Geomicrobium TaxID=2628951 RepID=UPI00045F2F7E|nr:DUF2624 family protein [Geomicrobium sp. JCM 19037]GAK04197.1 hypothetical protein JCM19037_2582 [Geomicrobium sp. JCM 19037]
MWMGLINQYVKNMSPQELQSMAASRGVQLTYEEADKLLYLARTEKVNLKNKASVYAFIDKVEKATSKSHAMLLYDLYAQYSHKL